MNTSVDSSGSTGTCAQERRICPRLPAEQARQVYGTSRTHRSSQAGQAPRIGPVRKFCLLALMVIGITGAMVPLAAEAIPATPSPGTSPDSSPPPATLDFSYGVDAWIWWLDDTFSGNLIELETSRTTPFFHEFHVDVPDFFGFHLALNFFLNDLLNPFGMFNTNLDDPAISSGGWQARVTFPLRALSPLIPELDERENDYLLFRINYLYRTFTWNSRIASKWLDNTVDYFDQAGVRHLYAVGDEFSTGSRLNDFQIGLKLYLPVDIPLIVFAGLQVFSLEAPTLLSLEETGTYNVSAEVLMHSTTTFTGLRAWMAAGADPEDLNTVSPGLAWGGTLGMTLGSNTVDNLYLDGPDTLGFSMSAGLNASLRLPIDKTGELIILLGAEGTFSLLTIFGSADQPGTMLQDLPFHAIGLTYTLPQGTQVDVMLSRWETFVVPFLKVWIRL